MLHVLIPRDALSKIAESEENDGSLQLRHVAADNIFVVSQVEIARNVRSPVNIPKRYATLLSGDVNYVGRWIRTASGDANAIHQALLHRPGSAVPYEEIDELFGVRIDPGGRVQYVITHAAHLSPEFRDAGVEEFVGWAVTREGAVPHPTSLEPEVLGLTQLADLWPLAELSSMSVAVVGCGSIGSVAADALAGFGVGSLRLVDFDRLLWHNEVRHLLGPESVGRLKSDALAESIRRRWSTGLVTSHPLDVVHSADLFRPIVREVDLVLCAADGIAPRRVVSHVSRRARVPSVLACVLDRGAVGEIIRLRPSPRFGCLLCLRSSLAERGAIDAEADQELAYGTGSTHQPMTAVPSDLQLIGVLAAKAAVATLLESKFGDSTQALPGEHAVMGLRPGGNLASPFDVRESAQLRWSAIPAPRNGCPTCRP